MLGKNKRGYNASASEQGAAVRELLALRAANEALKAANPSNVESVVSAISKNINVWGVFEFAADEPSNKLPQEIRDAIKRLAAYTRYISVKAARTPRYISDLIEINEQIMSGLRRQKQEHANTQNSVATYKSDV